MTRRPFALLALSFVALAATACADSTAPVSSAPSVRQIQPSGQAAQDGTEGDVCRNGFMTSTGRAC
jgi:hypothetical protein